MDESKVPKKIQNILNKGLDMKKHPYCVAFSMMQMMCYQGTWGNGSFRFLHCVCKMIDDGRPQGGTTMISAQRVMRGWGVCDEDLFPSDVDLEKSEFEDWKRIPNEAWENAERKRIQTSKALVESGSGLSLKNNGQELHLFTYPSNLLRGQDRQFDLLVVDSVFETVAWTTLRAYVANDQIVLEDLFVKPQFRQKAHLGSMLLHRIEQIACLEEPFSKMKHQILAPLSIPDAGPVRYNAVRAFFLANGYVWKSTDPIRRNPFEWSSFTALKDLDCSALHNDYALELASSKEHSKAIEQLKIALQLDSRNARIHTNYAIVLLEMKDYVGAEDQLRQALEIDDQDAWTYSVYGNLTRELRRNSESEKYYLRALQLKEDFPLVHNNYGNLLRRMGRASDAESHFRRALEIEELPETHYSYALLLTDLERYKEAEDHFKRALEMRKEFPEATRGYANCLSLMGRPAEAEQYHLRTFEIKDDYVNAHSDYAHFLAGLKRYNESEQHYLKAIEIAERDRAWIDAAYLCGELGAFCEKLGKLKEAEANFAKALEISKRIGNARLQELTSADLARVRETMKKKNE